MAQIFVHSGAGDGGRGTGNPKYFTLYGVTFLIFGY